MHGGILASMQAAIRSGGGAPSIGARVRELREKKNLSQSELARRCGMHRSDLCKIEGGDIGVGLKRLERIALALGVSLSKLRPL
jgi:transcriptional regulator with XRE-family HTH domain